MGDKEVTLQIRIPLHLRDAFNAAAKDNDMTSSQLLRAYIKQYIKSNERGSLKL